MSGWPLRVVGHLDGRLAGADRGRMEADVVEGPVERVGAAHPVDEGHRLGLVEHLVDHPAGTAAEREREHGAAGQVEARLAAAGAQSLPQEGQFLGGPMAGPEVLVIPLGMPVVAGRHGGHALTLTDGRARSGVRPIRPAGGGLLSRRPRCGWPRRAWP
jgi:hypothetical protein